MSTIITSLFILGFLFFWAPATSAHCVASPGVQCVHNPCHHPKSAECLGEKEQTRKLEATTNVVKETTQTPFWRKLGDIAAGVLATNASAAGNETVAPISEVNSALDALASQLGKGKPPEKKKEKEGQQRSGRDPLIRTIPPPPGSAGEPGGGPSVPPSQTQTRPSTVEIRKTILDQMRRSADTVGIVLPATLPATLQTVIPSTAGAPPEAATPPSVSSAPSPTWLLERHKWEMGEAFQQLQNGAGWNEQGRIQSGQITEDDVATRNLHTNLEQVREKMKKPFVK